MDGLIRRFSRNGWLRFGALGTLILIALLFRLTEMGKPLEYDEIFTLHEFANRPAGEILHALALPNNHPLNTLAVKAIARDGAPAWCIRLPSLVAGILAVLAWGSVMLAWRGRSASCWTMLILTFSAPLAVYSQLARGYSMQIALLGFFFCGLAWYGKPSKRPAVRRILCGALMFVGAAGAVLTLSSSVMYLVSGGAAWLILRKRGRAFPWFALIFAAAVTVGYLAWVAPELQTARAWGEAVTLRRLPRFLWECTVWLAFYPVVLLALLGWVLMPRKTLPLLLPLLLPLFAAVITRCGPVRVYLPGSVPLAFAAGIGAEALLTRIARSVARQQRPLIAILLALLILWGFVMEFPRWRTPDWGAVLGAAKEQVPQDTFVVYPAHVGLILKSVFRKAALDDYFDRLYCPEHAGLLMLGAGNGINGSDANFSEKALPSGVKGMPVKAGSVRGRLYRLEEVTSAPASGEMVIVVLTPVPQEECKNVQRRLFPGGVPMLRLNLWLNVSLETPEGTLSGGIFAVGVGDGNALWSCWNREKSEKIRFYRLR